MNVWIWIEFIFLQATYARHWIHHQSIKNVQNFKKTKIKILNMDFYIFIFMRKYGDNGTANDILLWLIDTSLTHLRIRMRLMLKITSGI